MQNFPLVTLPVLRRPFLGIDFSNQSSSSCHSSHYRDPFSVVLRRVVANPSSDLYLSGGVLRHQPPIIDGNLDHSFDFSSPKKWVTRSSLGDNFLNMKFSFPMKTFQSGSLLFGFYPNTWYHWLLNILPKLWMALESGHLLQAPVLVPPNGLKGTFWESLSAVVSERIEIRSAGSGPIFVNRAQVLLSPYFEAPGRSGHLDDLMMPLGSFCIHCLRNFRDRISESISAIGSSASSVKADKIYLRRTGSSRPIDDSDLVHSLLRKGFVVVEPESLSFAEQVLLFKRARTIVGISGSVFANILFSEEADVYVLQPDFLGSSPFLEISKIGNNRLTTVGFQTQERNWSTYYRSVIPARVSGADLSDFLG